MKHFILIISAILTLNVYADMMDYYMMAIVPSLNKTGTITSPSSGRIWMDRNLGASATCTQPASAYASVGEYIDAQERCFGGYYQWGRDSDGHEAYNSTETVTQSATRIVEHGKFIANHDDWMTTDTNGALRSEEWNPCPEGFYVPTSEEFEAENISNIDDAFNKLKMPLSGSRHPWGDYFSRAYSGDFWSKTVSSGRASLLSIANNVGILSTRSFASGKAVRCIQEPNVIVSSSGKTWMDRNLGAMRACQSYDDEACYGDYYQWGRTYDGHQKPDSDLNDTQSATTTPAHGSFITVNAHDEDWMEPLRDSSGSIRESEWNVCPFGFRIPTWEEVQNEFILNREDAFAKLKLPASGFRQDTSGSMYYQGNTGYLWTTTPSGSVAACLFYFDGSGGRCSYGRANGYPVRCIKEH